MNDINIFQELEDLRYRKNISQREISVICSVKQQSAHEWFTKKKVNDKYLWLISDSVGDERFQLALFCYEVGFPKIFLDELLRYKEDSLSMLLGTQREDEDSDFAISDLLKQLSSNLPSRESVMRSAKEMLETGSFMMLTALKILKEQQISVNEAVLDRK